MRNPDLERNQTAPDGRLIGPEERAAFLLGLRERGIRNLSVLRAMEAVSRADFILPRYLPLAHRDVALPDGLGGICPSPLGAARLLQGAGLQNTHRVLEIGTATGYLTALLCHAVAEVVSVARFAAMADESRQRLISLGIENATVHSPTSVDWAALGIFDRVVINYVCEAPPEASWAHVAVGGSVLFARRSNVTRGSQVLVRANRDGTGLITEVVLGPARYGPEQFTAVGLA